MRLHNILYIMRAIFIFLYSTFIVTCVGRSKGLHTLLLRLIVPHAIWPIRNVQCKIY